MTKLKYVRWFAEITYGDVPLVGGKNASLGEMYRELTPLGVRQANGFAITAEAYVTAGIRAFAARRRRTTWRSPSTWSRSASTP
jgi:Pyruvate phosphate dikinase, AMP/ATP-binding domain